MNNQTAQHRLAPMATPRGTAVVGGVAVVVTTSPTIRPIRCETTNLRLARLVITARTAPINQAAYANRLSQTTFT